MNEGVEAIRATRLDVESISPPAAPGIYAIFLLEGREFALPSGADGLLYIGSSTNLAQRDIDTHFSAGASGFSTLRRSIGALLKEELDLRAIPRGTGMSPTNFTNYRFTDEGEARLTKWMRDGLEVGYYPTDDPGIVEAELITSLEPVLNLRGWANPEAAHIGALRKRCADESRLTIR